MHHDDHGRTPSRFTLGDLAAWCGASHTLSAAAARIPAGTILHDSRQIGRGDIFLALKTETNDGHQYIEAAFRAGAAAAIAAKKAQFAIGARYRNRILYVNNPLRAVQKAARTWRDTLGILMIGVTGSSGKTTTRSFIARVLEKTFDIGETWTNWNNHIGVPLSILRFSGSEWLGIIEMGANHTGEIHALSKITKPDIGVITNIGYAHVGLFGSLEKTTEAKFEIADGLNKKKGFLLLNGDDPRLAAYAKKQGIPSLLFGFTRRCEVVAENVSVNPTDGVSFTVDGTAFRMKMPGRHFIYSALPAIILGRRCGVPDEIIAQALAAIEPVALRGTCERIGDTAYIVDCYNANPSSMKSALVYLDDVAQRGRRIAVLGEMLELGNYTKRLHRDLGSRAAQHGLAKLVAVGPSAEVVAAGAVAGGMRSRDVIVCEAAEDAATALAAIVGGGDTVLLKGSRGMRLEKVYEQMKAKQ